MATVKTINSAETTAATPASRDEIVAATFYEEIFVPALFARWSPLVVEAAGVARGDRVLDVACGTGTATRAAAARTGPASAAVGLDIAPGMLSVARSLSPQLDWHHGSVDRLPFDDGSFDRVLCQFGLMFFADTAAAIREMLRVLRPGGRLAIAVWDRLERNPGFADKVEILEQTAGTGAADALRAPFCLGDRERLCALAGAAGMRELEANTHRGEARFRSLEAFVDAEVRGWLPVMDVHLDEATIGRIVERCRRRMHAYAGGAGGEFVMPTSAHILAGTR